MFAQKIRDLFEQVIDYVSGLYARPDVQEAISTARQMARELVDWLKGTITANPEAAVAGAIVTLGIVVAISVITLGLIITSTMLVLFAVGSHVYFMRRRSAMAEPVSVD